MKMPNFRELMKPTLVVIDELGGSGTIEEIAEGVIQFLNLPDSISSRLHDPEKSSRTEVEYRLAWARTYLKHYGVIDNSERGVWSFTDHYSNYDGVNPEDVVKHVRDLRKAKKKASENGHPDDLDAAEKWREALHQRILSLDPSAFERLSKRLLREVGFVQVEVTGKSGDGGIDGKGIVKIQDVLSYHVVFSMQTLLRFSESECNKRF